MPSLRATLRHPEFRNGIREMAAASPGIAAWGLVTGIALVQGGLSVPLALLMTFTVFAGSAQLAALPLMAANAPIWVVWATAFCVNLRFVVFSAQWRPFLKRFPLAQRAFLGYLCADLTYVMFMHRHREPQTGNGQMEYFAGATTVNWLSWQVPSVAGILLVDRVPAQWGLGFAGVLALLGLGLSLLADRATAVAAAVAGAAAIAAFALPLKLGIVAAIAAAVCVGLLIDGLGPAERRSGPSA
jgi:predicted branched-subunit amino acid permease